MNERQVAREDLLPRVASGESRAVRECLERYSPLVWTLARKLWRDTSSLEDVVQEVFIEVWKHAARFDATKGSETTFIAVIARRRIIDRQRRYERAPKLESIDGMDVGESDTVGAALERGDDARIAAQALAELRPEQRRLILLNVVEGLTHQEIATETGMPLGTIKSHIRRGLSLAAEALRRAGKGEAP
jgi:RNA polymerase sigma-70 factor (ECF subfamily)